MATHWPQALSREDELDRQLTADMRIEQTAALPIIIVNCMHNAIVLAPLFALPPVALMAFVICKLGWL